MSENEVAERVARGAEWLDETRPGWERTIDLSVLDLADGCKCIVGQLYEVSGQRRRMNGFWYAKEQFPSLRRHTVEWGFLGLTGAEDAALDAAWTDLIKTRFDTGALSDAS